MSGKDFLILGAGELGMAVVRGLFQHLNGDPEISITVLLRPTTINSTDSKKSQQVLELRRMDISFLAGDLVSNSISELSALFRAFDTVIGCTGYGSGQPIQKKIAQAILDAEVARYFPWQFGVDYNAIGRGSAQDLFDEQLDVRDLLRSQERTEWVIISTGMFISFLFESWFGVVDLEKGVVRALGSWENALTVTAPDDIGKLTASIAFATPKIANQVVYTAGDTITFKELADQVDMVLGRRMRRELWTMNALREELKKDPANVVKKYRVVFGEGKGVSWNTSSTFNHRARIPVQNVKSWIQANLKGT